MKVPVLFILITILVCTFQPGHAQSATMVSDPHLSLHDNVVHIAYDILYSSESEKFSIRVEVSDAKGRFLNARTLSGDIGEHVLGGYNKLIFWDIKADSIFLDEEIFVQVYALAEPPPVVVEPVVIEPIVDEPVAEEPVAEEPVAEEPVAEEPVAEKPQETEDAKLADDPPVTEETMVENEPQSKEDAKPADESHSSVNKSFNRSAIILQSVALPGLGLSRVNPGKPHWIRGVVGYGCIAGSLYFNNKAASSYEDYKNSSRLEDVDDLYNKAVQQDVISEVLAYTAIGIWVVDLVWTFLVTSDLNLNQPSANHKGFSVGTTVEPVSSAPLIALRYKF